MFVESDDGARGGSGGRFVLGDCQGALTLGRGDKMGLGVMFAAVFRAGRRWITVLPLAQMRVGWFCFDRFDVVCALV